MKKLLSLTLATILCLSLLPVAFSVCIYEESEGGDIDTANLLPCIESIVYDADIWGLDGKLDSLYIGKPIHNI